jgi:hypothetical protein
LVDNCFWSLGRGLGGGTGNFLGAVAPNLGFVAGISAMGLNLPFASVAGVAGVKLAR